MLLILALIGSWVFIAGSIVSFLSYGKKVLPMIAVMAIAIILIWVVVLNPSSIPPNIVLLSGSCIAATGILTFFFL